MWSPCACVSTIASGATATTSVTAEAIMPAGINDTDATNNRVIDSDTLTPQADLRIEKTSDASLMRAGETF